jgi:hypothetical protein
MWVDKTFAAAASLVASTIFNPTEVPLSDKPVSVHIANENDKLKTTPSTFEAQEDSEFDLQNGLDWNSNQPTADTT